MIPSMERGRALVLIGPQGSGKSLLAHELARHSGTSVEALAEDLAKVNIQRRLLMAEAATCVVEGFPHSSRALGWVKSMITAEAVGIRTDSGAARQVRPPNFIFCTGDASALSLTTADRRFKVVRLEIPARRAKSAA